MKCSKCGYDSQKDILGQERYALSPEALRSIDIMLFNTHKCDKRKNYAKNQKQQGR